MCRSEGVETDESLRMDKSAEIIFEEEVTMPLLKAVVQLELFVLIRRCYKISDSSRFIPALVPLYRPNLTNEWR